MVFQKACVSAILLTWFDRIRIWCVGSLSFSDDLINFLEESIKTRWPTKDI